MHKQQDKQILWRFIVSLYLSKFPQDGVLVVIAQMRDPFHLRSAPLAPSLLFLFPFLLASSLPSLRRLPSSSPRHSLRPGRISPPPSAPPSSPAPESPRGGRGTGGEPG